MYLVHCLCVGLKLSIRKTRREFASRFPPPQRLGQDSRFFHPRTAKNGIPECSSGPKAESTVDPKELGWQAATCMAATPDALVKN